MEPFPEWATRFYGLYSEPYLPDSSAAKSRVESGLPRLLKHLPEKGSEVLDLCCGAGAYLFPLEQKGYKMTGLDIQRSMIAKARKAAKKTGSRAKLVVGDAMAPRFKDGSFDAVVFMGAPFAHFSLDQYEKIASQSFRMLRPKGKMIAEVNDHVGLFLSGTYQRVLYEPYGGNDAISIHTRYDAEEGTFGRLFLDLEKDKKFKGSFRIWTPWILSYIMRRVGFELKVFEAGSFGLFSRLGVFTKP
jgi:ubiquinone/menaquinone biosynthesis C-methylase UbiE